ncbi:MAG: ADP/ATP-dependent (S)-NAD(P)H-hydrate dehydratase [Pseudomonadota bacterium]
MSAYLKSIMRPRWTDLAKSEMAHKYGHGHCLVLSGGAGATGAARLAASAALRIGAGLVTIGTPSLAVSECAHHVTSLMLTEIDDVPALEKALSDPRITSTLIGPGHGRGARTHADHLRRGDMTCAMVQTLLATARPTILDADALTCWDQPEALFEIIDGRAAILTPHAGEFRHLFPDIDPETETVEARGKAVQRAAARSGAVILLKGPDTIISTPDGEVAHLSSRGSGPYHLCHG